MAPLEDHGSKEQYERNLKGGDGEELGKGESSSIADISARKNFEQDEARGIMKSYGRKRSKLVKINKRSHTKPSFRISSSLTGCPRISQWIS